MNNFIYKKYLKLFFLGTIFFGVFIFLLGINIVKAEEGLQIFFSGTLLDKQDLPAESTYYNMQFSIYQTPTSTDSLWEESFVGEDKVWVENGTFRVVLGLKNPIELNFENTKHWLAVSVGEGNTEPVWDEEMSPRIPVTTLKNLLLEGIIDVGEKDQMDFMEALLKEFEKNATSSEGLSQRAFLTFLQEKISTSGVNAVIISPDTLNILLEEVFNLQEEHEQEGDLDSGIWQRVLSFFRRILDTISEKLSQISGKISEIFTRLVNIELGINKILSIIDSEDNHLAEVNQTHEQELQEEKDEDSSQVEESGLESLSFVEDFGQTVIPSGEKTARIFSSYVISGSKIFISPRSPISGIWWISERKEGEFFEVSILVPIEEDLVMDYWIVVSDSMFIEEDSPSEQAEAEGGIEEPFEDGEIEPIEEQQGGAPAPEQGEQSPNEGEEVSNVEDIEEDPSELEIAEEISSAQDESASGEEYAQEETEEPELETEPEPKQEESEEPSQT